MTNDSGQARGMARVAGGAAMGLTLGLLFSPLRSKLFVLALLGTLAGAGVLVYGAVKGDEASSGVLSSGSLRDGAPWALRVGVSFMAAFVFAFLLRKVVKWALLVGGTLIAAAVLVHTLGLGLSAEHVEQVRDAVESSAEVAQDAASSLWARITPYLPSGGAAGLGMWRGARHGGRNLPAKSGSDHA